MLLLMNGRGKHTPQKQQKIGLHTCMQAETTFDMSMNYLSIYLYIYIYVSFQGEVPFIEVSVKILKVPQWNGLSCAQP